MMLKKFEVSVPPIFQSLAGVNSELLIQIREVRKRGYDWPF
jgi:hypothetical protein